MQSSDRRGLISTTLDWFAPIGNLASCLGFSKTCDRTADFAVRQYQKHLSPRKGFCCAYAKLHGELSCSAYFHELLTTQGFTQAIQPFQQRLQACQQANLAIRASRIQTEDEGENPQRRRQKPSHSGWCDAGADMGNAGNCACEALDFTDLGACEAPDCNFGDCDISGCDGCDGGGCDF